MVFRKSDCASLVLEMVYSAATRLSRADLRKGYYPEWNYERGRLQIWDRDTHSSANQVPTGILRYLDLNRAHAVPQFSMRHRNAHVHIGVRRIYRMLPSKRLPRVCRDLTTGGMSCLPL